jgi:hypothetical protein
MNLADLSFLKLVLGLVSASAFFSSSSDPISIMTPGYEATTFL